MYIQAANAGALRQTRASMAGSASQGLFCWSLAAVGGTSVSLPASGPASTLFLWCSLVAFLVTSAAQMLPNCVTIVKYQGFYLFAASLILAALWSPFWEVFLGRLHCCGPPGSLMRVLWSAWDIPLRSLVVAFDAPVYARSSFGSLWGAREVRRVVPACFLVDIWAVWG